jgi:hypothetical protein
MDFVHTLLSRSSDKLSNMPGPFDKPHLTAAQFTAALLSRGFRFCANRSVWVGPFGITVTGVANESNFHTTFGSNNPTGIGTAGLNGGMIGPGVSGLRKSLLAEADEKLRAKRGQPRPLHRPAYNPPNPHPPPH